MDGRTQEELASSFVSSIPSGIKAVPTQDDSDSESVYGYNSDNKTSENDMKDANSGSSSTSSSSKSSSGGGSSRSSSSGSIVGGEIDNDNEDESFMSGEEDFVASSERKGVFVGEDEFDGPFVTPRSVPRARVSEDEDDDDDGGIVVGGEDVDKSYVVKNVPRVRFSDDEGVEEAGGTGSAVVGSGSDGDGLKLGEVGGEVEDSGNLNVDSTASLGVGNSEIVESNGVKYTNEGDSVVDAIHVDVVEALRSRAAVVGEVDETEVSSAVEEPSAVKIVEGGDESHLSLPEGIEESGEGKSETVEESSVVKTVLGEDESHLSLTEGTDVLSVKDSGEGESDTIEVDGVKLTSDGDSVVDAIKVDVLEAVRSGAAVVGEVDKSKGLEVETVDPSITEDPTSATLAAAVSGEGDESHLSLTEATEALSSEESGQVKSETVEVDGVKLTSDGDSVVDAIQVDVLEAVRSGAAVVGEVEKSKDLENVTVDPSVTEEPTSARVVAAILGEGHDSHLPLMEGTEALSSEESGQGKSENVVVDGVKLTSDGDSVVDAPRVDVLEVVRSGAAVVGEEDKSNELEVEPVDPSGAGAGAALGEGDEVNLSSAEGTDNLSAVEDSASAEPVAADGQVKFTGDGDSVVEAIHVDAVEAARSGAAVVGGTNEVEQMVTPADISLKLGNDFHPLVGSKEEDLSKVNGTLQGETEASVAIGKGDKQAAGGVFSQDEPLLSGVDGQMIQQVEHANDAAETDAVVVKKTGSGRTYASVVRDILTDEVFDEASLHNESAEKEEMSREIQVEAEDDEEDEPEERGDVEGSGMDEETDGMIFGNSAAARQFFEELVQGSDSGSHDDVGLSYDHTPRIDGQIVTDSDEEDDSDEEEGGKQLFDSAALAALLKAASSAGSDSGTVTITSQEGSRLFTVERPAGLGPSLRAVRPSSRSDGSSLLNPLLNTAASEENLSDEDRKKMEKIQELRVTFLRLVHRLGQSAEGSVAGPVLYRLALLAGRSNNPLFSLDNAKQTAMQLEAEGEDDLSFSLNIVVLGKLGVGKSTTINSIFGEQKVRIDAFEPGTNSVTEINGVVDGVKIRVFDTPGLESSGLEQGHNRKVLASVKKLTSKSSSDIVLYVDRLDSQTRDLGDLPLLKTITSSLGSSVWKNAIVTLTHAGCAPPDGPSGSPLSYEVFVAQRSHLVQQSIGQAVGDLRMMNPSFMSPISLVENHPACRKNREGQKVLPNGLAWRSQLLLLCYSMKILSEANSLFKPQDPFDHRKLFGFRVRAPPLPYLLSSLLQPRAHPKLPADQGGDNGDSDIDLDDFSESEGEEEEDEYDQLPPFKPLRKSQIAKLSREQSKAYFEEYDYRVKLLQRRQWKEELKRMRQMKRNGKPALNDFGEMPEDLDQENGAPTNVAVPLPDMVLPPSFDCDSPGYRYRFLEPTSQFIARPVLDTHGWDHDCGYDGVNVEQSLGIGGRFPASAVVQVTKDKKDFNIHLDSSIAAKHGETGSSLAGIDIQTIGKQFAYILRGESKFKSFKKNKTAAGVSVTFLGENVATGVKIEDQLSVGKRFVFVGSSGVMRSQKDAAYGANLELRLKDADFPIGQNSSSFVLSLMKWRGDLAIGGNLQSQFSVGRNSKMAVRVALNNKLSGQITVRTSSSDHLQLALAGLLPIALGIFRSFKQGPAENDSMY